MDISPKYQSSVYLFLFLLIVSISSSLENSIPVDTRVCMLAFALKKSFYVIMENYDSYTINCAHWNQRIIGAIYF